MVLTALSRMHKVLVCASVLNLVLLPLTTNYDLHACLLLCSTVLQCKLRSCFLAFSFPEPVVSFGHVVRYKLIRVSLGTRMAFL